MRCTSTSACGLLVADAGGRILRVNATLCSWLGYSANELAGTKLIQDLLSAGGKVFYQTHWAPLLQMQGSVAEVKLNHDAPRRPYGADAAQRGTPSSWRGGLPRSGRC